MASENNDYVKRLDACLAEWRDERFVTKRQVRAAVMVSEYLVNLGDSQGWTYDGQSFKVGAPLSTLVIKATISESPVVTFISGRSWLNCAVIFCRRLEEDSVEWREDRYRA